MNARDIISTALCGFDTEGALTGDPANLIQLTLEKAKHEACCLVLATSASDDTLTAGSLEGRIEALSQFIDEYMVVTWKEPRQALPELNGAEHAAGSAES